MKLTLLLALFVALACNQQPKHSVEIKQENTITQVEPASKTDLSKYHTAKDTLMFMTKQGDTVKYGKEEFNDIVDKHSELIDDHPQDPDPTYYCHDKKGFNSEAGQDAYYLLYSYFLKQKNGIAKYSTLRKNLIDIYANINSLFRDFQYGGTYFGHQHSRIEGYAEYSVYLYKQKEERMEKSYDITKEKELYIKSLQQLIDDEVSIDGNTQGTEKIKRKQELNDTVAKIEKAITNVFYLRRAQAFQYGYYEYY